MDSDKTNELDSYGVWVKKPVNESTPDSNADESFGITPDLPDFSSLDDIQEASPSLPQSAPINDSFVSDDEGDTSLSMEELSNQIQKSSTKKILIYHLKWIWILTYLNQM